MLFKILDYKLKCPLKYIRSELPVAEIRETILRAARVAKFDLVDVKLPNCLAEYGNHCTKRQFAAFIEAMEGLGLEVITPEIYARKNGFYIEPLFQKQFTLIYNTGN